MTYQPNTTPLEDDEQKTVVKYLEARGLKFTAIPNNTFTPYMAQKAKNRAMGLRPGLPDLLVVLPGVGLLFIEMKRVKGGVTSPEQLEWIAALNTVPGVEAVVCKGAAAAIAYIEQFVPLSSK